MKLPAKRCIVVGIGNPLLKDNRAGIEVVEALKACNASVETATLPKVGIDVLETILGYDQAVIVDVCQTGMPPGTVLEMTPEEMFDRPLDGHCQATRLVSALKTGQIAYPEMMPADLKIVLLEAEDMSSFSTRCTPVVSHAVDEVVSRIHAAHA